MEWFAWADDKTQVIFAVTILTALGMFIMPLQAAEFFPVALAGLFGIAVGTKLK